MKYCKGNFYFLLLFLACGSPPLEEQRPVTTVSIDPSLVTFGTPQLTSSGDSVYYISVMAPLQYAGADTFDSIGAHVTVFKNGDTVAAKDGIAKNTQTSSGQPKITRTVPVLLQAYNVFSVSTRQVQAYESRFDSPYLQQFSVVVSQFVGYK
jgi:hypothetical protein